MKIKENVDLTKYGFEHHEHSQGSFHEKYIENSYGIHMTLSVDNERNLCIYLYVDIEDESLFYDELKILNSEVILQMAKDGCFEEV